MAALVPVVDSLDKVPEAARSFYEQKDGKYHLSLEGAPAGFVSAADLATANGRVVEFRDKNIALMQEVEPLRGLKTKFDGIDPEAAKTALAKVADLEKKGIKGGDDITAAVTSAVEAAVKPLKDQLLTTQQTLNDEKKRADEGTLRSSVAERFLKSGGKAKALDFIVGQAKSVFTVENGVVKAAANKFSTERPGEPLSLDEWVAAQVQENDFAFEPSKGSGAPPQGPGGSGGSGDNRKVIKDPTPQQLGEHAADVKAGKTRFEYTQ